MYTIRKTTITETSFTIDTDIRCIPRTDDEFGFEDKDTSVSIVINAIVVDLRNLGFTSSFNELTEKIAKLDFSKSSCIEEDIKFTNSLENKEFHIYIDRNRCLATRYADSKNEILTSYLIDEVKTKPYYMVIEVLPDPIGRAEYLERMYEPCFETYKEAKECIERFIPHKVGDTYAKTYIACFGLSDEDGVNKRWLGEQEKAMLLLKETGETIYDKSFHPRVLKHIKNLEEIKAQKLKEKEK